MKDMEQRKGNKEAQEQHKNREQHKKPSVLKRLLPYAGKKGNLLNVAMLLSALSGIFMLMPMVFIHIIARDVILNNGVINAQEVFKNSVFAVGFAILGFAMYTGALIVSHQFAFEVEHNIIKQAMSKLINMPLGFFDNRESGKLRKIIIDGAGQTHSFLAHQLPDFASTILSPIVLLIFFFVFDWKLGLASLIPILLGFFLMSIMMTKKNKQRRDEYFAAMGDLASESVEYVRAIPVVKTFAQSVESFDRFYSLIQKVYDYVIDMTLGWKNSMSLFEAVGTSTAFFIVPFGMLIISKGGDIKTVVANSIIYLLIGPVFSIFVMRNMHINQYMYFAQLAIDKIDDILDYEALPYLDEPTKFADKSTKFAGESKKVAEKTDVTQIPDMGEYTSKQIDEQDNSICFKDVSFSYEGTKVLEHVSFKVEQGSTVALVGPSGGGKTTIAKLAARFYDVKEGEILIGARNIKDYPKQELMKKISFVFQNSKLFKMSLRENLLLAKKDASDEEIEHALSASNSKEIIERLETGLDTIYGTKGTYFSGGEIQRLSIARAFLKDANIVILDEATAFADPENEHLIQESFAKLSKNKTTLMIAHRLSTIVGVDEILVVDGGKIVQRGTHQQLVSEEGMYQKMWEEYQKAAKWKIGGSDEAVL